MKCHNMIAVGGIMIMICLFRDSGEVMYKFCHCDSPHYVFGELLRSICSCFSFFRICVAQLRIIFCLISVVLFQEIYFNCSKIQFVAK